MLSMIVAMGENRVIGKDNTMPWHLPNDLQYFKKVTTGKTIIMGRKTFDSLGRVLPNRKHIVLTRSNESFPDEVVVVHDVNEILEYVNNHQEEEVFIIGGGQLFSIMLPHVDRLYVTLIKEHFSGDVYFPEIDLNKWHLIKKEKGLQDEKNRYEYYFLVYERHTNRL